MSQTTRRTKFTIRGWLECVVWLLRAGLVFYLAGCVIVAIFQRRLIYIPPVYPSEQVEQMARTAKLERWKDLTGQNIGMKRPSPRQPAEGRVLIVYGNGSCATGCAHYATSSRILPRSTCSSWNIPVMRTVRVTEPEEFISRRR